MMMRHVLLPCCIVDSALTQLATLPRRPSCRDVGLPTGYGSYLTPPNGVDAAALRPHLTAAWQQMASEQREAFCKLRASWQRALAVKLALHHRQRAATPVAEPDATAMAGPLPPSKPGLPAGLPSGFPLLASSLPGMGRQDLGLPGQLPPPPPPLSAPPFALDMFGDQPPPQPLSPLFLMQQQMAGMQAAMQQGGPASSAAAAVAAAGLPLHVPGRVAADPLLLATALGLPMLAPGGSAATAQVPADVLAAFTSAPSGLVPLQIPGQQRQHQHQHQHQLPSVNSVNPAVLAGDQGQPVTKATDGAAGAAAAAGHVPGTLHGASTGSGRPKRARKQAQAGSSKRQRRASSEDVRQQPGK